MRKILLLLTATILISSCKKKELTDRDIVPTKAVVAGYEMIDYDYPAGKFVCRAPADWKGREDETTGAMLQLFGPGTKENPVSVSISIIKYPGEATKYKTAEEYLNSPYFRADGTKYETLEINGRKAYRYREEQPFKPIHSRVVKFIERTDTVLINVPGGYYSISHSAPVQDAEKTLPVFEAVVQSFTPKG